ADPAVTGVVELDLADGRAHPAAELKAVLEGATALVHLGRTDGAELDGTGAGGVDVEGTRHLLDAAGSAGVDRVVVLSSATVYGAWPGNPVPLTEEAPLRPNPGVAMAAEKAELEQAAADWRADHPGSTVTLLRPAVTVSGAGNGWLARALSRSSGVPVTDDEPPAQYLDVTDLAAAVDLARRARIDGPRNVAPDGWVDGETVRALAGGVP